MSSAAARLEALAERACPRPHRVRHRICLRGPLPGAAVPGAARCRGRRGARNRGHRCAGRRGPAPARLARCWPIRDRSRRARGAAGHPAGEADVGRAALNLFDTQIAAAFERPAELRGAARAVPAHARVEVGHVHALGPAAADRRAALLRTRRRGAPAAAGGFAASGSSNAAGWSGRERSPARSRTRATSATPRRSSGGCRGSPTSRRRPLRWRRADPMAGRHRRARGPPRALDPPRPGNHRDRAPSAHEAGRAGRHQRREGIIRAAPRPGDPGCLRARGAKRRP